MVHFMRMCRLAVLLALALPAGAMAETYPSHPIRVVVPFAAGGPLDIVARAVTEKMAASMKQTFVIDNRGGAGGNIGNEVVAKAAPDGYTILITLSSTLTVNPSIYKHMSFNPIKDLRPVSMLVDSHQMLVVNPSVPAKTLAEFIAYAKSHEINYAHAGYGSPGHLAMEYFSQVAGFKAHAIPYRGNAPLVVALLAGDVQAGFVSSAGVAPQVRQGKLRAFITSGSKRSTVVPEVPTAAEAGYPNFKIDIQFDMLVPAATPDAIVAMLEREARAAVNDPDLQKKFEALDFEPIGSTGAEAKKRLIADTALWSKVVKQAGMHID
ncbi:MAG TPA: tripartite tricarboxylate transporter substrate binding protein [Xanthobacteraceae bacterium]|jgi:tripartite-type tricarboxylate transporter receptor subunit TctC|nr:tripartite tricarboxylate transporter substrate binding protein [Xanthobacteraceae bacterium]